MLFLWVSRDRNFALKIHTKYLTKSRAPTRKQVMLFKLLKLLKTLSVLLLKTLLANRNRVFLLNRHCRKYLLLKTLSELRFKTGKKTKYYCLKHCRNRFKENWQKEISILLKTLAKICRNQGEQAISIIA